jgi:hypothetical protein
MMISSYFNTAVVVNGMMFSTRQTPIVPFLAQKKPMDVIRRDAFHMVPEDFASVVMLMNEKAASQFDSRWGRAYLDVHDRVDGYDVSVEVPDFGKYINDKLLLKMFLSSRDNGMGAGVKINYRCGHFGVQQIATIDNISKWKKDPVTHPGISAISIHMGAELLIRAMVLNKSKTRDQYPRVHRSIIKGGLSLANALTIGLAFGGDYTVVGDEAVSNMMMNGETPSFSVKYRPDRHIDVVQSVYFDSNGLKQPFSPFIEDLMVAAALMRPNMLPLDGLVL